MSTRCAASSRDRFLARCRGSTDGRCPTPSSGRRQGLIGGGAASRGRPTPYAGGMSTAPVQVPPSPMSLGDVFTATFSVFRRRIGAFLGLTGLQQLVTGVAVMVPFALGAIVLFPVLLTGSRPSNTSIGLGLLLVLGGFFVAAVALGIVTPVSYTHLTLPTNREV